ncbi:MAG: T9SS type A sorting domain-containing protein [Ignavibacteria bacterium]|nr:T9SS type A sorting domain-containing protein [Ignavibacteria bacterium]
MTPSTCGTGLPANSTGNFTPKSPLGVFNNTDPNGAYILRVSDNAASDTGSIRAWSVTITYGPATGVSNNTGVIEGYKLSQNYPNPFNPSTVINYTIPKTGLVTLKVFDISGREVANLVNEVKNAGTYDFKFYAGNLSSGVYFYRLQSGNFVETKKMFLVK